MKKWDLNFTSILSKQNLWRVLTQKGGLQPRPVFYVSAPFQSYFNSLQIFHKKDPSPNWAEPGGSPVNYEMLDTYG